MLGFFMVIYGIIRKKQHQLSKQLITWWLNQPIWKAFVNLDHFPRVRGEKKTFETRWAARTMVHGKANIWVATTSTIDKP